MKHMKNSLLNILKSQNKPKSKTTNRVCVWWVVECVESMGVWSSSGVMIESIGVIVSGRERKIFFCSVGVVLFVVWLIV